MKRISIIVIVAIVCSLWSVLIIKNINHKTHQTSYEFTKEQIENRILINEITNSINENYLLKTFSKDDAKEQINEQYKPIKQSEVVKELTIAKLRKSILASKNVVLDYDLSIQQVICRNVKTVCILWVLLAGLNYMTPFF